MDVTSTSPGAARADDPCTDVDCESGDVIVVAFDLAGVQAGPNLYAELSGGPDDRRRAADCPGAAVEGHEYVVTSGVDLAPVEPGDLGADERSEPLQQGRPRLVADRREVLGGRHDVDEEHGREHPVDVHHG